MTRRRSSQQSYLLLCFQHPFIRDAHDAKPVLDLLAEYKAEIVEDEIMDLPEDKEVTIIVLWIGLLLYIMI